MQSFGYAFAKNHIFPHITMFSAVKDQTAACGNKIKAVLKAARKPERTVRQEGIKL